MFKLMIYSGRELTEFTVLSIDPRLEFLGLQQRPMIGSTVYVYFTLKETPTKKA